MINIATEMNQLLKKEGYNDLEPVFKRQLNSQINPFDLVVSAFTLSELSNDVARRTALELLWEKTNDVNLIVFNCRFLY